MARKPSSAEAPDEVTEARAKRPTDTDMTLIRAALHQQGQLLSALHEMLVALTSQVEEIKRHIGVIG